MYLQPSIPCKLGSLREAASPLPAQPRRRIVISCGLALIALLATSSLAAASDPIGTVSDLATPSAETSSPESPEPSEPSLTVEVTASSEPSLTAEVTASSEPSLSVEPEPPQAPVPGELPVEPVPPPQTLLAPVTELVADQPPAAALPEVDELVAPSPPLDGPPVPSTDTDTDTSELLRITELDATTDVPDVVAPLLLPATQALREPIEDGDEPAMADPWPSARFAIDGRDTLTGDGEPAQPDTASGTLINSTRIVRPAAADRGWDREGILASVAVPRVAAGSGGSEASTSITLYPIAAVLAAIAAGGAGWRILALRMPPNPTGICLAAPVPPG